MLKLSEITKQYGSFLALDRVDFEVNPSEIVGLLGENGAGKSTLLSIVSGNQTPTSGAVQWHEKPVHLSSPRDATRLGIGVVHQHFKLVPGFTIAENVALQSSASSLLFREKEWQTQIETWAAEIGWRIDPTKRIEELSVGERQRVEILKALFVRDDLPKNRNRTAQLLLLDEPTTNLTPPEVEELFEVLRRLREQGCGIVFVSHKLKEVLAFCDRAVVLRRGRVVGERAIEGSSADDLAEMMVGHALASFQLSPSKTQQIGNGSEKRSCLEVENLSLGRLREFSLQVRCGEIVGIAGVDGNGQSELLEAIAGLKKPESGTVHIAREALALIPADRQTVGLIPEFKLFENLALHPALRQKCRTRAGFDWTQSRQRARELMEKFDVRAPDSAESSLATQLSGGNQQKLVIVCALSFPHQVVVASDPTRGLDVAAARFVHEQLREAARAGAGVLLISTDLDEILALCDRIGVLYNGRLLPETPELLPKGVPRETIGALMGGVPARS